MLLKGWILLFGAIGTFAACQPRREKVVILETSELRHIIIRQTNEHVVELDIVMSEKDWKLIQSKDTSLEYQDCPTAHRNTPTFFNFGLPSRAVKTLFEGQYAYRITFDMFSTNVPSEIEPAMRDILCVSLGVTRGYGRTSYYSDRVPVRR
jgi:hypothetical protein